VVGEGQNSGQNQGAIIEMLLGIEELQRVEKALKERTQSQSTLVKTYKN